MVHNATAPSTHISFCKPVAEINAIFVFFLYTQNMYTFVLSYVRTGTIHIEKKLVAANGDD